MLFWWLDRFWMHQMNSVFLCAVGNKTSALITCKP
jgi:hypothetical protein